MIELPRRPDWMKRASCLGMPADLFFPGRGDDSDAAKAVCASCEVQSECLDHGIALGERWGIYGGLTERQRRTVRRQRNIDARDERSA